MKYFYHHDFFNLKSGNGLYIIHKFKIYQQKLMYTCAPASVLMILKHLDKNTKYTEKGLAKIFKTRPYPYGTELVDIINGLKSLGYKTFSNFDMKANRDGLVFKNFLNFKKFVIKSIKDNKPILVLNVDYGGHYKVIIGYDEVDKNFEHDMLIFADPLDINDGNQDGYTYFSADKFFNMWFDNFEGREKTKQGFVIIEK